MPKILDEKLVDVYMHNVSDVRGIPIEKLKSYADMINGSLASESSDRRVEWATRQVYIVLGVLIASAAQLGVDIGPMEGFDPQKFDEILGLDKMGYESKVAVAVGFRASDDANAHNKKALITNFDLIRSTIILK